MPASCGLRPASSNQAAPRTVITTYNTAPADHAAIAASAVGRAGIGPPESRNAAAMTSDWVPTAPRYQLPLTSMIAGLRGLAPRYREGQPQPRQQRGLDRGRGIVMLAVAGEPVPEYVARGHEGEGGKRPACAS